MQNSFVKLLSIAGVVGIGTLVVLEVQNRLPQRQRQNPPAEISAGSENQVQPDLVESEFDRAGFLQDSDSVVYDAGMPDDLLDLAEPLGEPVDSYVDPDALTDGVDPFADTRPQSSAEYDEIRSAAEYDTSVPVQPAAFRGAAVSSDEPLPIANSDDPFADDSVDFGFDSFDESEDAVASAESDSLTTPAPGHTAADPFAGMDVLDEPFEDDHPSTEAAAAVPATASGSTLAPGAASEATEPARPAPAGGTGNGTNQLMFLSPHAKRETSPRPVQDASAHSDATSAAPAELKTAAADDRRPLNPAPVPARDETFEPDPSANDFDAMFEPDDEAPDEEPDQPQRHDHEHLTVPEPVERRLDQPDTEDAGLRPARDSETPSTLPFFPEDDDAAGHGPAERERDEFSLPDDRDTPDSWNDEPPLRDQRPSGGFGDEPAFNDDRDFRDDRDNRGLDFDRDINDRGDFDRDDEFEDSRDFPNDRRDRDEPAPRDERRREDELRRVPRPDRPRRTPESSPDFNDDRRPSDDRSDFNDFRPQPVPSSGRSDFDDDRASSDTPGVMRPHLSVRKEAPPRASVGQPLTYTVIVTNEGQSPARDVIVEDELPQEKDADLINTQPAAEFDRRTGRLVWTFDELAAGDTREMQVKIVPRGRGVINGVATVRFKTEVSTTTIIESPRLTLTLKSPSELRIGDEVEFAYVIRNDGDGRADDVVLRSVLPVGLRHPVGDDLEYEIDSLMPGDEREVVLKVVAAESGVHQTTAEVTAAGGVRDEARSRVNIVGQQLSILRRGPKRRYVGRSAVYENIISNDTAFEANDVRVIEQIPDGMEFVSASSNGAYNPRDGRVTWEIDRIDAGDTKTLTVELIARRAGQQQSTVTVVENAGFKTGAEHTTAVEDLHNMSARISQLDRAVATGEHFDIDITLENRGTADATNVQLVVDVPRGIVPRQAGSRDAQARPEPGPDGTVIVRYEPIRSIAPGAERTFRIRFAAESAVTNGLIRARLQYSEMRRELITSESVTAFDSQ